MEDRQRVCRNCGLDIRRSPTPNFYGLGNSREWVHEDGGYHLCIIDGKRPGQCAEPE